MILIKGAKQFNGKRKVFSKGWCWHNWIIIQEKKVKLNRNLTLYIFKNWIWTDLNKKANYYKTSERKQNIFMTQKAVTIKENKKYRIDLYEFKTLAL